MDNAINGIIPVGTEFSIIESNGVRYTYRVVTPAKGEEPRVADLYRVECVSHTPKDRDYRGAMGYEYGSLIRAALTHTVTRYRGGNWTAN